MDLYSFYKELNKKLLDEFKKIMEKNPGTATPLKIKKRLTEKLVKWMNSKDAPDMNEMDKRVYVAVSRFPGDYYAIRTVLGVNKMCVMTKYRSDTKEFTQYVTKEGNLKPTVDI